MENLKDTKIFGNEQNKSLEQIDKLLLRQTQFINQKMGVTVPRETFVENIDRDEMRSGFLVTSQRKRLWNLQIEMIQDFARVCKKHNLKWFAYGGTLLGAARHKGFIPWDDDVDLAMLRPDYEKFRKIAAEELNSYYIDFWYRYKVESEGAKLSSDDDLQFVNREWEEKIYERFYNWPFWPMIKVRHNQSTMLQFHERKNVHQGIFIDVFALDPVDPFSDKVDADKFEKSKELFMATNYPRTIRQMLENNQKTLNKRHELKKWVNLPFRQRALNFEEYMAENFFQAPYFGEIRNHCIGKFMSYKREDFEQFINIPFEKIEISVPIGYDDILTAIYGDWRKMKVTHVHSMEWSVDIPYTEYIKRSALMRDRF